MSGKAPPGAPGRDEPEESEEGAVFAEIEEFYFGARDPAEVGRRVLERAPPDVGEIEEEFVRLKRGRAVVSRMALRLISMRRDRCDAHFGGVVALHGRLEGAVGVCRAARLHLKTADAGLALSTLKIVAGFRRKGIARGLLAALGTISSLRRAEEEARNLARAGEFAAAVGLVLAGLRVAAENGRYACVAALARRLREALQEIEARLETALAAVRVRFDADEYGELQRAHLLLDRSRVAADRLHAHFSEAVREAFAEAAGTRPAPDADDPEAATRLLDLGDRLWPTLVSYRRVVDWHRENDDALYESAERPEAKTEFEANVDRERIKEKIREGPARIWKDVQRGTIALLAEADPSAHPFERFARTLAALDRLAEVGEHFCGDPSEELRNLVRDRTAAYLRGHHAGRLDVLRIFLENEGWEPCPVRSSFTVLDLREFEGLKRRIRGANSPRDGRPASASGRTRSSDASDDVRRRPFADGAGRSPFAPLRRSGALEEHLLEDGADSDGSTSEPSDDDDELKREFVDEGGAGTEAPFALPPTNRDRPDGNPVVVANATISVLRDFGQYLQMCRFLRQVSFEAIMLMSQMFDYYLFAVHLFFASDLNVASTTLYSTRLSRTLKRIGGDVRAADAPEEEALREGVEAPAPRPLRPRSFRAIDLESPERLNGLAERIAATESLVFMSKQLEFVRPYLESLILPHQKMILQTFYEQTVEAAVDVRVPVYMCVASRIFDVRSVLISMSQTNWEAKSVMSQHSKYVDSIVRDLQVFSMRLDEIGRRIPVSHDVHRALWSAASKFTVHTLVEGFSNVSKCSDSGRGLMQLDYTQLLSKLEKISGIKPAPFMEYVDVYVKAYYLPRSSLQTFIVEHREYSVKHLTALVNCTCDSKKGKQELIASIENRDNSGIK